MGRAAAAAGRAKRAVRAVATAVKKRYRIILWVSILVAAIALVTLEQRRVELVLVVKINEEMRKANREVIRDKVVEERRCPTDERDDGSGWRPCGNGACGGGQAPSSGRTAEPASGARRARAR